MSTEILADENRYIFPGRGKIGKILNRMSKDFRKQGEKSETGGNASLPQRGWTPLII